MQSEIRDINLAESGIRKIEWVKRNCDLLRTLEEEFSKTKPFGYGVNGSIDNTAPSNSSGISTLMLISLPTAVSK